MRAHGQPDDVALAGSDLSVEVLDEHRLRDIGMGALLAVGQGSIRPPRVVVMQYSGGAPGAPPVAFIGKGVTFDTGGISSTPATGMAGMTGDRASAARRLAYAC